MDETRVAKGLSLFADVIISLSFLLNLHWMKDLVMDTTPRPPKDQLCVLIVDDNPVNRKIAHYMLVRLGHDVSEASSGIDAVTMLDAKFYDAVLMDVQMPEMDGLEATRRIRKKFPLDVLPIIAVTANENRITCITAGMNDHLEKPLCYDDLEKILAKCRDHTHGYKGQRKAPGF